jgi:multidrug resistance efflux pump
MIDMMRLSNKTKLAFIVLALCPLASSQAAAAPIVVSDCLVSLVEETQVATQEEGELTAVIARDGQEVAAEEVLARVDDKIAKLEWDLRQTELKVAEKRAEDTVSIDFAKAAAKVYEADYWRLIETNKIQPRSVPKAELEKALLQYEQYRLQTEKSEFELEIAKLQVNVSKAQVDAANERVVRHEIKAPWGGVVEEVFRHTGDWLKPGDPVLRLVRMDNLKIKCSLNAAQYSPDEVMGRPVTVTVKLAHGVTAQFEGKIAGVSPLVDSNNQFLVWAEVANKKRNGYWVLRSGMMAEMSINMD